MVPADLVVSELSDLVFSGLLLFEPVGEILDGCSCSRNRILIDV